MKKFENNINMGDSILTEFTSGKKKTFVKEPYSCVSEEKRRDE